MEKCNKDRYQKELSIQYCLARGMLPFMEAAVRTISELADFSEVLTDLDVLGVEFVYDSSLRRVLFDCKTTNKLSPINRAFWAGGISKYTGCDEAFVLLKSTAVYNHRVSALKMHADLHDEKSFRNLGLTLDPAFGHDTHYQSSVERWNVTFDAFSKDNWSKDILDLARNVAPLSQTPWNTFRIFIAEFREVRGHFDPAKPIHVALFLDALSSIFVLWASLGRDIRRFYDPTLSKGEFEKILRYYIWGGKESYEIRRQLREKLGKKAPETASLELPAWDKLVEFVGLIISSPQDIFYCSTICREMSMRLSTGPSTSLDKNLSRTLAASKRARQFSLSLSEYMVAASSMPKDMAKEVERMFLEL